MTLILASSSPRRSSLLTELGVRFRAVSPDVDETRLDGESPRRYVRRVALDKARAVASQHSTAWVLAADTTVALGTRILGKPSGPQQARAMLRELSGRSHRVYSGIALVHVHKSRARTAVSSTRVVFRELTESEIRWYVETGEPLDKAGAYGAQGKGGLLVERYEGSFTNVVGLPLEKLHALWRAEKLPGLGRP